MLEPAKKPLVVFTYVVLILSTLLVYWQVRNFDFVDYDDNVYVYENQHVPNGLSWDGLKSAFDSAPAGGNWMPLTWLSFMLDCQLFGLNSGWMHLVNVLLHLANALLLFAVLKKMTGVLWPSAFVAAAFALHPMHVESVAWITERKDVLSTFFLLLTLAAYVNYVRRGGMGRYVLTALLMALGLLAKPMLVTLPFLLLLLDYWPLNRFDARNRKDERGVTLYSAIVEKTPFFVLSAVSSVITFLTQRGGGSTIDIKAISLTDRVGNAFLSYATYVGKMFWPRDMAVFYPLNAAGSIALGQVVLYALLLVGISLLVLRFGRSRKYLLVGWFWFVGTLIPVIGLVQTGIQAYADRYTYIPYIGLFIMIAWGLPELLSKWPQRRIALGILAVAALTSLGICAHRQASYWNNDLTLFAHAIEVTPDSYVAHTGLGGAYGKSGRLQEAMEAFNQAISICPGYGEAYNGRGNAYSRSGRYQEAIGDFDKVLRIKPNDAEAYNGRGNAYGRLGRLQEAMEDLDQAIRIKPGNAGAYNDLGVVYGGLGRWQDAIEAYKQGIRIRPDAADTYYNLGNAYGRLGRWQEAIEAYEQGIRINPDYAEGRHNLGAAYGGLGRWREAIDAFTQAIRIRPDHADAYNARGAAYGKLGRSTEAVESFRQAIEFDPDYAEARSNLANELVAQGSYDEAVSQYRVAIRLKPDWTVPMNNLAWLIASNPEIRNRDANEAVRLATRACELTDYKDVALLDTLAGAYAFAGRFTEAADTIDKALSLAEAANQPQFKDTLRHHLSFYKQGKPYIEPAPEPLP